MANRPQVIYSSYIEYESKPSIWISQEMKIMPECAAMAHPSREILKLSRASLQAKLIYINSTTMEANLLSSHDMVNTQRDCWQSITSSTYLFRLACSFQLSFLQVCGVGLDPNLVPVPRRALRVNWPLTLLVLDKSAVKISENISSITTKPMSRADEEKPREKKCYMWHLLNGPRYI